MEVREIKALLALMQEYGLVELEIDDKKKGRVRLVRARQEHDLATISPPAVAPVTSPPAASVPRRVRAPATDGEAPQPPKVAENERLVTSPMVGTFYRAASPDATPFVEEGDSMLKGQTLCIIEAMKMMTEIEADVGGRIAKILCQNGQAVEYGQPLMVVEIN
jgi:acetyl-CoA carboxylase biotin carboxyl carrier protein